MIIESIGNYLNNKETSYSIARKFGGNQARISYILRNIRRHNNELERNEIELIELIERGE